MKFNLSQLPFWSMILIQIMSFIIIILPTILSVQNPIFFIFFILLEGIVLTYGIQYFLTKKNTNKLFFIAWEIQFFLYFLTLIIFYPQIFFVVEEVSPVTSGFFAILIIAVEILILIYILFQEKAVEKILLTLALSTTVIVFLIVFFVMKEGLPAFQENDPIEFLTGTTWQPFYEDDYSEYITLRTHYISNDFNIYKENNEIIIPPNSKKEISFFIENLGSTIDNYSISIQSNLSINLAETELAIDSLSYQEINFTIYSDGIDKDHIIISVHSMNHNKEKKLDITCITAESGVILTPSLAEIYLRSEEENTPIPFTITNAGSNSDSFNVSILADDHFRPSIRHIDWDYSTSSGIIFLEAYESIEIDLIPRLVKKMEDDYNLTLKIISENDPSISEKSTIIIHYTRNSLLSADYTYTEVPLGETASFPITIDIDSLRQDLILSAAFIQGNGSISIYHDDKIILNQTGSVDLDFSNNTNNSFTVSVTSDLINNEDVVLKIKAFRKGTKPIVGILPFIVATLISSIIAVCIAGPLGLGCAIFLAEFVPDKLRKILRPLYELLAGIPSVLYGLWGFATFGPLIGTYIYPFLSNTLGQHIGLFAPNNNMDRGILTASIVLSIMILPIVITLSEDAIRSVSKSLKEGSLALGATRWQTMKRVIIPKAKSGIVTSIILGTGRAIGETMAVLMIMGLTINLPTSLFDPSVTMTGVIAGFFESTFAYDYTRHALFGIGTVLFIMVFTLNIIIARLQNDKDEKRKHKPLKTIVKCIKKVDIEKNTKKTTDVKSERKTDSQYLITSELFKKNEYNTLGKSLRQEKIVIVGLIAAASLVSFFLFYILSDIIINGGLSLQPEFFFQREINGGKEGGFLNAIMGSLFLVLLGVGVSAPLSIGAAIYVQEYARKNNIITKLILFTSDTLASTPSIIFGAFGFMFFVLYLDFGYSLIAGGLTLAIMIIPLMLRSSIEAIKAIPREFQEGSLALGATKWQSIRTVVLPPAMPGVTSGVIISMGRAIGETAAVLLTAGYALSVPVGLLQPAASMPNLIFSYYDQTIVWPVLGEKVFSAAFILILVVLILNGIARLISVRSAKMMKH